MKVKVAKKLQYLGSTYSLYLAGTISSTIKFLQINLQKKNGEENTNHSVTVE